MLTEQHRRRLEAIRTEQLELITYMREHLDQSTDERTFCAQIFDRLEEIAAEITPEES